MSQTFMKQVAEAKFTENYHIRVGWFGIIKPIVIYFTGDSSHTTNLPSEQISIEISGNDMEMDL